MRRAFLAAVLVAASAVGIAVPASAAASFGHGDAAWDAYYKSPSSTGTWNRFCQGGGGSYLVNANGVPACGSTGNTTIYLPVSGTSLADGTYTPGFQCVELAERYLLVRRGWSPISGTNGAQVVSHYASAHGIGVVKDPTSGKVPAVGTVMSFSDTSNYSDQGHAAVVTAVKVDGRGNGSVTIVSENVSGGTAKSATLTVSDWVVSRYGFAYVEWLNMSVSPPTVAAAAGAPVRHRHRGRRAVAHDPLPERLLAAQGQPQDQTRPHHRSYRRQCGQLTVTLAPPSLSPANHVDDA